MNYAVGYTVNANDLFCAFKYSRLKYSHKLCMEDYKNRHEERLMCDVFDYAVKLVMDDVIHNNATFHLPTMSKKCKIYMKRYEGEDFKRARKLGKWKDVDILESNFSGYLMVLDYQQGGVHRVKRIYLDPVNRDLITGYTNAGRQYF